MTPEVPIPDVETIRKEKKPFAHFQWNYGWGHWEQVIEEAAGHDGVFAAYLAPCDHDNKLERLRAENKRLREALVGSEYWIGRWAKHVGNCSGSDETCTCGRTGILFEARAALAEKGEK